MQEKIEFIPFSLRPDLHSHLKIFLLHSYQQFIHNSKLILLFFLLLPDCRLHQCEESVSDAAESLRHLHDPVMGHKASSATSLPLSSSSPSSPSRLPPPWSKPVFLSSKLTAAVFLFVALMSSIQAVQAAGGDCMGKSLFLFWKPPRGQLTLQISLSCWGPKGRSGSTALAEAQTSRPWRREANRLFYLLLLTMLRTGVLPMKLGTG